MTSVFGLDLDAFLPNEEEAPKPAELAPKTLAKTLATPGYSNSLGSSDTYPNSSHSSHSSRGPRASSNSSTQKPLKRESLNSIYINDLAGGQASPDLAKTGGPDSQPAPPAKVARVARVLPTPCNQTGNPKSEPARVFADSSSGWRAGFALLSRESEPCPGLRRWPKVHSATRQFLDRHADQAEAFGWSDLELFGVHPVVGAVRVDHCGALMLGTDLVVAISADAIGFANGLVCRRRSVPPGAVLVWNFGRGPA